MSRRAWIGIGVLLAVALGFGIRQVDLALKPPEEGQPEQRFHHPNPHPFVRLTAAGLWLDGDQLATSSDLSGDPEQRIDALIKELGVIKRGFKASNPDLAFAGIIGVCADPGTSFALLRRVLVSCRLAGYDFVDLGSPRRDLPAKAATKVRARDCSRLGVRTKPRPQPGPDLLPAQIVHLELLLAGEGIVLQAGGLRRVLPAQGGQLPFKRLGHELKEIKKRLPNKDDLVVSVGDEVRQVDLMRALINCDRSEFTVLSLDLQRVLGDLLADQADCPGRPDGSRPGQGAGVRASGGPRPNRHSGPWVRPGRLQVRGPLSREVVRRIVRRHVNEVKYCYQKALSDTPTLAGSVEIQFTISAAGQVVTSKVARSSLSSRMAEQCIARSVKRWLFPKPRGGVIVRVSCTYELRPPRG